MGSDLLLESVVSGPLFKELVLLGTDVEKKSCQVFRASFVRHLSTINDWHISCHFLLLFVAVELENK